ncbi:MAG: hypothetical protein IJI14_18960 [Anaerolineaceae bacterium]|nr:hypothetical protein [Anaerolineaceae bacterium]
MNDYLNNLNYTATLRNLILDNPDLPLMIFAGQDACDSWNCSLQLCNRVNAYIGEILNCDVLPGDTCYTDRDEFRDDLEDYFYSDFAGTEAEFNKFIDKKLKEYKDYWIPCIILEVDN